MKRTVLTIVAASLLAAGTASAAPIIDGSYTTEAAFVAAAGSLSLITFDALAPGGFALYSNLSVQGVAFQGTSAVNQIPPGSPYVFSTPYLGYNRGSSITILLPTGTQAVGFDATGFYNGPTGLTLSGGGQTVTGSVARGMFETRFLGITSDTAFSSVTLSYSGDRGFALDNFRFTAAPDLATVPEPGSIALAGMALAALGWARARRSR